MMKKQSPGVCPLGLFLRASRYFQIESVKKTPARRAVLSELLAESQDRLRRHPLIDFTTENFGELATHSAIGSLELIPG